jgi:ubiquinone/menaquinone biosynthesis C-methylase UbiE
MREALKRLLKKSPRLYSFVAKIYSFGALKFRYLEKHLLGTRITEREWARRDVVSAQEYWANRNLRVKIFLANTVFNLDFYPRSILEVGSNCGPNLYHLAKKFPDSEIVGTDINKIAIQMGSRWLGEEGITNVKLIACKAEELNQFNDKYFDVVFTFAVLLLIGPDKIERVMEQIIRVAKKRLILIESYGTDPKDSRGLGFRAYPYWKRDYVTLFKQFVPDFPEDKIHIGKFPEDLWAPGVGGGTLIEFSIE